MPILAGAFVQDPYQREQWTPFWLTSAAIMGSSGLIFLIFGDTSRQHFADDDEKEEEEEDEEEEDVAVADAAVDDEEGAKGTNVDENNNNNNNDNAVCDSKLAQIEGAEAKVPAPKVTTNKANQ